MSFGLTIKSVLEAGTWTNWDAIYSGEKPPIFIVKVGSWRGKLHNGVSVQNGLGDIDLDFTGSEISNTYAGMLKVKAKNATERDALKKDVKAILKASDLCFNLMGPRDDDTLKSNTWEITVSYIC